MTKILSRKNVAVVACAMSLPLVASAQTTVFSDNFSSSTLNGSSTPTATSTSYDIASTKAATTGPTIGSGDFKLTLNGATGSGFVEAQAVFTSTPVTLATVGDYVNLTYTFTDTANLLVSTSSSSFIWTGLYNSGGSKPLAGSLNNSGLSTVTASPFATGGTSGWLGYVGGFKGNATSGGTVYSRPAQTTGTTSANQDLVGNAVGGGAYTPAGTQLTGGTSSTAFSLTTASVYTISEMLTLGAGNSLIENYALFRGPNTNGTALISITGTAATPLTTVIDSLGFGIRNSGASLDPIMDVSQLTVTDLIQTVPEPGTLALVGGGASLVLLLRRRAQK